MKKTGLIFHNDLDGLYSAKLIINSEYEIDDVFPADYGMNIPSSADLCDNFISVDFAENIFGEKTELFVDHHIRSNRSSGAKKEIIKEAPSCVDLLLKEGIVDDDLISGNDLECINAVDTATFDLDPEDVLFPDLKTEMGRYIMLNELMRKNRKSNMSLLLLMENTFDINSLLYIINSSNSKFVKTKTYFDYKMKFFEKFKKNRNKFVKEFSGIPALFTSGFSQYDWKGYDRNIFNYLYQDSPFTIIVFQMNNEIHVQIQRNIFAGQLKVSLYEMIKDEIEIPRGHDNILMFTFKDLNEAIIKLDNIISIISENI
jgi:hypothetical protein